VPTRPSLSHCALMDHVRWLKTNKWNILTHCTEGHYHCNVAVVVLSRSVFNELCRLRRRVVSSIFSCSLLTARTDTDFNWNSTRPIMLNKLTSPTWSSIACLVSKSLQRLVLGSDVQKVICFRVSITKQRLRASLFDTILISEPEMQITCIRYGEFADTCIGPPTDNDNP